MWVIIRKSDRKVMGMSGGGAGFKRDEAIEEVLRGLPEPGDISKYDTIEIEDSEEGSHLVRALFTGQASVRESGSTFKVVDETPEATMVTITTDAREFHPLDKVPLIPGDGKSFLSVSIQKVRERQRTPLNRATEDSEVIWLRTNHGTLREAAGEFPQEIRSVKLESGQASFRIYSEKAKRLATVDMLSANPALRLPSVRVEFI